jgi:putative ABC transport system substrate-binding protein
MRSVITRIAWQLVLGFVPLLLVVPQQSSVPPEARVYRIGFLGLRPLAESTPLIAALKDGLRDLGYIEGKNYVLEARLANDDPSRYPELIDELTKLNVKLVVAASTPAAIAIHKRNPLMPIVVRGPDLVGAGLARSASHPGGVATGIEELSPGISDKKLRFLKQASPSISDVAVLSPAPTAGGHAIQFDEAEQTAKAIGVTLHVFRVSATTNFDEVFAEITKEHAQAILCLGGVLPRPVQRRIADFAAQHRLPAMYPARDYIDVGGLMSYAYRSPDMLRFAAAYVDKILRGAKPGDLPLTSWTKYYLTVNLKAAALLGITLPPSLVSQAEEVVR